MHDQIETLGLDNVKVYGISYDKQSSLKKFSDDFGIGYDLLADEDSAVIKKFGILNTTIDADTKIMDRATGRSYYGLPFPGVYVTDEKGVVIEKFFYRHYASRASAGTIMNSALGEILMPKTSPSESFSNDQIKITAFLADDALKFEYYSKIYVRLEMEEGLHIYGGDLPDGFVATTVTVDDTKGLRAANPVYPETSSKVFKELDVTLDVYDGVIDIEVPVSLTAEVMNWIIRDKPDSMDIPLNITYQACSDSICYTPKTQKITVKIPVKNLVMPNMTRR